MSSEAPFSKKRRSRVALKPTAGATGRDLATAVVHPPLNSGYSTVPRVMRPRIAKATQPPKSKTKPNGATDASNQPIARSNSGKVALGPWSGAFASADNDLDTERVLYIDRCGSTHKDLNETSRASGEGMEAKRHRKGTALATSPAALIEIPPPDETTMKLHSREVSTLQQKPIIANWGRSACGKQACKGRATAKVGFINQPKRGL